MDTERFILMKELPNITLFAVDDDPIILDIINEIASTLINIECFESAEACQLRIQEVVPDLILLDICLGGIDGYTFCRQLKNDEITKNISIIFVSSHESIDARLEGYDAGADDFIVKPFDDQELLRKIRIAGQIRNDRQRLITQANAAEELSSLVLASKDEGSILLQFMSKLIGWDTDQDIAEGMLDLMRRFGINATVQTRTNGHHHTLSKNGCNLPLEVSILSHVVTLGRIFEFRTRSVYNFDYITVLINNVPIDDPDLCGRIRDNVAIAAQGADGRLAAIDNAEGRKNNQNVIYSALKSLETTLEQFGKIHKSQRLKYNDFIFDLERELQQSFVHLGLTMGQEHHIEEMIKNRMLELMQIVDQGDELETNLISVRNDLSRFNRAIDRI